MSLIRLVNFNTIVDARGELIVLESNKEIPFNVKRIYYSRGAPQGSSRGYHAHKQLQQIIFPIVGRCRMLLDNGELRESIILDSHLKGLLVGSMIWHEMHDFSKDCVLVALANDVYNENDYIRDYQEFLKLLIR